MFEPLVEVAKEVGCAVVLYMAGNFGTHFAEL